MQAILEWIGIRSRPAISLFGTKRVPRKRIDRIYVLRVDFKVDAERAKELEAALEPLRQRYGLDFVVLEPGMTLSRFDEL